MSSLRRAPVSLWGALLLAAACSTPALAQPADTDFKKLIEQGRYAELGQKLRTYLEVEKADPKLRAYLELNLKYLERGAKTAHAGSEVILVRGAKNDKTYKMPATSGGSELFLPNSIRYMRSKWDPRLKRIGKYFTEATTSTGGNGQNLQELERIIEHHKGGGLGTGANSTKSVLISASTTPQQNFGPPYYILKVAPERAIFNWKGLGGEREVLLPFWVLPHEIVAKCNSYQEVLNHPLYKESKLKEIPFSSYGYNAGGNANNWSVIENNIRNGRPPLEGLAGFNSYFPGQPGPIGPSAPPEYFERFKARVEGRGGVVEMVEPGDKRLPKNAQARTYLDHLGRPHVLLRKGEVPSKVALLDELTHVIQLKQLLKAQPKAAVEELLLKARAGDAKSKDVVNRFEIRAKRLVNSMVPASDVATKKALASSIEKLEKELDPYRKTRRANGTIDWKRAGKQFGSGLGHFTLALFLKELAVVSQTGDALLIEEFFQGLLKTDFYIHYGLFSFGAAATDMAYAKYLEKHVSRYVRPRFVNSVLRSQLSLAVGMALPDLVMGKFEGRTFAINLAGLGLSSAAVKTGVAGIKWVANATRLTGGASFLGKLAKARKLAAVSGWVYTAAETAVVLYYGDKISRKIDAHLERKKLQEQVREAVDAMLKDPKGDGARERADAVTAAFRDYRDFTSRPLYEAEGLLTHRLGKLATDVKQNDDAFRRMQETVAKRGLDSLGGAARRLAESRNEKFQTAAGRAIDAYERSFKEAKTKVYREGVAINTIDDDEGTLAALRGEEEPTSGSVFSRFGRGSAKRNLLESVSTLPPDSRLGVYDQEAELWRAMAVAHSDDPLAAAYFEERGRQLSEVRELDKNVVLGVASKPTPSADPDADPSKGFIDALEKLGATDGANEKGE
jgi:hypothetical protein